MTQAVLEMLQGLRFFVNPGGAQGYILYTYANANHMKKGQAKMGSADGTAHHYN